MRFGTQVLSPRMVHLTVVVVLGYFVRFKMVGEGFDTFEKIYKQPLGEMRLCALSYVNSLLVIRVIGSTLRELELGQLSKCSTRINAYMCTHTHKRTHAHTHTQTQTNIEHCMGRKLMAT